MEATDAVLRFRKRRTQITSRDGRSRTCCTRNRSRRSFPFFGSEPGKKRKTNHKKNNNGCNQRRNIHRLLSFRPFLPVFTARVSSEFLRTSRQIIQASRAMAATVQMVKTPVNSSPS